jgi:hypothetical protein
VTTPSKHGGYNTAVPVSPWTARGERHLYCIRMQKFARIQPNTFSFPDIPSGSTWTRRASVDYFMACQTSQLAMRCLFWTKVNNDTTHPFAGMILGSHGYAYSYSLNVLVSRVLGSWQQRRMSGRPVSFHINFSLRLLVLFLIR